MPFDSSFDPPAALSIMWAASMLMPHCFRQRQQTLLHLMNIAVFTSGSNDIETAHNGARFGVFYLPGERGRRPPAPTTTATPSVQSMIEPALLPLPILADDDSQVVFASVHASVVVQFHPLESPGVDQRL